MVALVVPRRCVTHPYRDWPCRSRVPVLAADVFTIDRREKVDLIIILIVLLLLFGGGGGMYWGMGAGWGLGPIGLILAVVVVCFLLFGYRGKRGNKGGGN